MLVRLHLPDYRSREDLEVQYLTKLMRRDAKIWRQRIRATLGKEAEEPTEQQQTKRNRNELRRFTIQS